MKVLVGKAILNAVTTATLYVFQTDPAMTSEVQIQSEIICFKYSMWLLVRKCAL